MVEIHEKNNNPQAKKRTPSYKNQIRCAQTGQYNKGCLLSGVILALLLLFCIEAMRHPMEYEATSKIVVQGNNLFSVSAADAAIEMVKSRRILNQAWKKSSRRSLLLQAPLQRNLRVEQSEETGVISISYTDRDGNQAAAMVNNLAEMISGSINRASSPHLQGYQETIKRRMGEIEEDIQLLEREKSSLLLYQNNTATQEFPPLLSQRMIELKAKIITMEFETDLLIQNGSISLERALEKRQLQSILQKTLAILRKYQTESVPPPIRAAAMGRQYREIEINLEIRHAAQSALEQELGALQFTEVKEAPVVKILEKAEYPPKAALYAKDALIKIKGKSICLLNRLFLHMEE